MREDEKFSKLVGHIYDTALDPARWVDVLKLIAAFVRGCAGSIYSKDAARKTGDVAYEFGIPAFYKELYFQKYIKLDPTTTHHFFADVGVPVGIADLMPYDEFLETRFYKEWVHPQRIVDCVNVTLEKSLTSIALIGIFRSEADGVLDEETRRRMRLIAPHVRRAVLVGQAMELKKAHAETLADTLEGISASMLLVGTNGRIVHANTAGHVMLDRGDVLRASGGRLSANDPEIDQTLADVFASVGVGDAEIGIKGIALPLAGSDGDRYVAHILPLTSGARRRAGTNYHAVAALFVHKASLDIPAPPAAIAKAYQLTPMQLRVLLAVVEVGGVPEVAEALGIAETTVKTHLGHVYEKTGASRQADLVKLVAGFSHPIVR